MATRREFLAALAWLGLAGRVSASESRPRQLVAAWLAGRQPRVGCLAVQPEGRLAIASELDVPTRAHGLLREPAGTLLAVARRPGDWLLRWDDAGRALAWRWIEPGRAFAGHLLASADGTTLYTTEIDLEHETGLIGVRDAATLAKRDEWPTHGRDPHQLVWDVTRPGQILVANGGVPTRPETGRTKYDLDRMDSSLVRLDGNEGRVTAQWRLDDPRLSLRHLAWQGERLGIALQAEHDDPMARARAPVLAVLEGGRLVTVEAPALAGYGGSIAGHGEGFAVACPKAGTVALFDRAGFQGRLALTEACPLASASGRLWAGGLPAALAVDASAIEAYVMPGIRLDNHWILA